MSAAAAGMAIQNIGQISIIVKDVERATAFYRDVLGLRLLFTVPSMAFFDCGGVRLMLDHPEKPEFDHASSILYFSVPDIHAAYSKLKTQNVKFEDEPHMIARMPDHDLWMTFFRDSEGNVMAMMSEVRR